MGKFYAVKVGRVPGVYTTWPECQSNVSGFSGAIHKSFNSREEAENFVRGPDAPLPSFDNMAPTLYPSNILQVTPLESLRTNTRQDTASSSTLPVQKKGFNVWTDGSYSPRGGGWAYVVERDGVKLTERSGPLERGPNREPQTNQRAELTAILMAMHDPVVATASPYDPITFKSDSEYSLKSIGQWSDAWARNGWKTSTGKAVSNVDLIMEIKNCYDTSRHILDHVYGHTGLVWNEYVDGLAKNASEKRF